MHESDGCNPSTCKIQAEGQSQRTAKEYCTLLSESSVFAFQNQCQSGGEPSKILTRLRVSFRANFGRNWWVLPCCDAKCESQKSAFSEEFMEFCSKILQRQRKKRRKMPCFRAKTSGFLGTNFRTLWQRSPMFRVFRPEMSPKSPFLQFCDILTLGMPWWLPRPFSAR